MRALITGVAGQDGTILSALCDREGVDVVGVVKPGTDLTRLRAYCPGIEVVSCDLADSDGLRDVVIEADADQVFNLGGFTAPGESWTREDEVWRINVDAVRAIIDGIQSSGGRGRLFQASSSHVFEGTDRSPQNEGFELSPHSPYARSKAAALELVREARDSGLFAVSGIMYNHESPLRGEGFVTRKVTMAVARISAGLQDRLELGDLEVARDWGWAPDYVEAMRLMLEAPVPRDYVLATGISHRLSFFVARAFREVGIADWADLVVSTSDQQRPVDTNKMVGDSRSAYLDLGWRHTVDFDSIASRMVRHDLALLDDPSAFWLDF